MVTGGASIEGTLYAPNAALNWRPTQNIEGNVIAASFTHGPVSAQTAQPREIHDFPFATTVSCPSATPKGTLTLVKNVDNTGGGTGTPGDWTLTADGPQRVSGPGNSPAVTNVNVDAGTYTLSESGGLPNYRPGNWSCTGGARIGSTVLVRANADVTCQITNTYLPPPPPKGTLTLVKHVTGGSAVPGDWTLTAEGPDIVTGAGNSADVTNVSVDTGDYALSESDGPADYTAGTWTCTGGALTGTTVTVATDADVTLPDHEHVHATPTAARHADAGQERRQHRRRDGHTGRLDAQRRGAGPVQRTRQLSAGHRRRGRHRRLRAE